MSPSDNSTCVVKDDKITDPTKKTTLKYLFTKNGSSFDYSWA